MSLPLSWEQQNTNTSITANHKLCNFSDDVYELNSLIFADKIGITIKMNSMTNANNLNF